MANSFEIIKYKQQVGSMLINSPEIIKLINNKEFEEPEELIGQNIFNFIRYPFAPEEEICYICFEVDVPEVYSNRNYLFKKLVLTFYIVSHERIMPTDDPSGGTRTDLLSAHIDKLFNNYKGIGKVPLQLISNTASSISTKHRCRILTFAAEDLNMDKCK
nr:MAG TPA: hypothetical protein [Caudoviricetes sp.]